MNNLKNSNSQINKNEIGNKFKFVLITYFIIQFTLLIFEVIGIYQINEAILSITVLFLIGKLLVITGVIVLLSFLFFNRNEAFKFVCSVILIARIIYEVIAFLISNFLLGSGSLYLLLFWYLTIFITLLVLRNRIHFKKITVHIIKSILFVLSFIVLSNLGFLLIRSILQFVKSS